MAKRIALVYRGSSLENPYIARIRAIYLELGFHVDDMQWQHKNFTEGDFVFKRPACDGPGNLVGILPFSRFLRVSMLGVVYDVVHCINEDVALAVLLSGRRPMRLFIDVRDGVAERLGAHRRFAVMLARALREIVGAFADLVIVPDENRKRLHGRLSRNALIMENSPPCRNIPSTPMSDLKTVVFSGSLTDERGLEMLARALERVDGVRCIAAGWFADETSKERLQRTQKCDYIGAIPHEELLRVISAADAVFAFYKPISANNINASPSKLFDAMAVGTPVIVNDEVSIATWVVDNGFGYSCPFNDPDSLARLMASLRERGYDRERTKQIFRSEHCWEVMEARFRVAVQKSFRAEDE